MVDLSTFEPDGFAGPVPVCSPSEASNLLISCGLPVKSRDCSWFKGLALVRPEVYQFSKRSNLLEMLVPFLGPDIVLWGALILRRSPGESHAWHTDIETSDPLCRSVTVWIPLHGGGSRSGLKVVTGSHKLGVTVQRVRSDYGIPRDVSDSVVEGLANSVSVRLTPSNGEGILFDGRVWHGSINESEEVRASLILQYASADSRIYRADLNHVEWPFRFLGPAPCLVVSGRETNHRNLIVSPPGGSHA